MVATAAIQEATDAGPNWNAITTARFNTNDEHAPSTSDPIPVPTTSTSNFSYWKTWRLSFTGSWTEITNVRIYTDGTGYGTGVHTNVGDQVFAAASYDQATGTQGSSGDEVTANHTYVSATSDFFTYTSGNMKDVDTGSITTAGTTTSNLLIVQMEVDSSASQGALSAETFTWSYQEI